MPSVLVALSQDMGKFGRICPTQWGLTDPDSAIGPFARSHWLTLGQTGHHPGTEEPQQGPCLSPPFLYCISPLFYSPRPFPQSVLL